MPDKFTALFQLNAVIALLFGLPLLLIPGRFLSAVGWAPVDPILSRILGAALLAFAWMSYRGMRANDVKLVRLIAEIQALFYILGGVSILRQLILVNYPTMVWSVFGILVVLGIAWIVLWLS